MPEHSELSSELSDTLLISAALSDEEVPSDEVLSDEAVPETGPHSLPQPCGQWGWAVYLLCSNTPTAGRSWEECGVVVVEAGGSLGKQWALLQEEFMRDGLPISGAT